MTKVKLSALVLVLFGFMIISCGKRQDKPVDPTTVRHQKLYNKWWYSTDNPSRGKDFFNSDGTAQMSFPAGTGTWEWGPNDSLYVVLNGSLKITLLFTKIEDATMQYWPNTEPLGTLYHFSTTKP